MTQTVLTEKRHLSLIGKAIRKADKLYPDAQVNNDYLGAFAHEYMILLETAIQNKMAELFAEWINEKQESERAKLN